MSRSNGIHLPKILVAIVHHWCDYKTANVILGDLEELYCERIKSKTAFSRLLIWYDFISLLGHGVLKPSLNFKLNNIMIIRNYLKVAMAALTNFSMAEL